MSLDDLRAEHDRWAGRQGALGDIEPTSTTEIEIERALARCDLIDAEIKRREAGSTSIQEKIGG